MSNVQDGVLELSLLRVNLSQSELVQVIYSPPDFSLQFQIKPKCFWTATLTHFSLWNLRLVFFFFFHSNLILSAQLDTRGNNDFTDYGI